MFDREIRDFSQGLKNRRSSEMFPACCESVTDIPAPEVVVEFQHVSETRIDLLLLARVCVPPSCWRELIPLVMDTQLLPAKHTLSWRYQDHESFV